ncbi:aromatic ring-hydroxylating oxygenase subunit alpha [Mycobacterium xenopi]|uniref:(2Fe-2S)-binding protein n=1 Tax=Mycobacterium xenopi TaxID=1789 RepID=A0AAD1GYZ0_MYCXE|nr:aromatic ring-hydroxylating dioxygenase subunit alpha [Mycobacterium xenopi]MDA3641900.1 aromatic ring-hydroxylating dioxygenase subunit alpha [Mycobacterium xenopi]MDA3658764.1 aromatic ring-hydroxylating dioxygenase subunit alpha [Mycobacterium xenopi]MDA3664173.1 aromatic ring-hydroxylating dioxygenase subunit alpha [Mycobacterium xenopi]ORX19706.1 (2Fe-2S)-binding protein [Mycobacterium xenopi]SPX78823.1 dioxygenase [Mycobacterium xenopi]
MAHFPKPAAGSWTENYPGLGTAPVDYTDSIDPAFFEAEREAIFKRTWLNVGRVERLPRTGSYFTKELPSAGPGMSVIVVKTKDGSIKAFHNMCRHRGNKLVWNDYPHEETSGTCRQFTCKYHAWRYSLDGELTFIQQEDEFFDVDKSQYGLVPVRCEVWEGFIFVNLDANAQPLQEYLGQLAKGIEGYPFHEMTEVYTYKAEVGANWKLFIDAFAEFYHAPVLHQGQYTKEEAAKILKHGFEALYYELASPHAMISTWGGQAPPADLKMVKPMDRKLRSGLFGPWDRPEVIQKLDQLPPGVNPTGAPQWGIDSWHFFPNFMLLIWAPGWYLTYHYWPTAVDRHIFETSLYFVPPRNARERLAQELAAVTFKEYALQDANTLEATQTMIGTRVVREFPLCDQEILLRHLHKVTGDYVKEYRNNGSAR